MKEPNMQPERPAVAAQTRRNFSFASLQLSNLASTFTQAQTPTPGVLIVRPVGFSLLAAWQRLRTAISRPRMGIALLGAASLLAVAAADEPQFVRFAKPQTLSF